MFIFIPRFGHITGVTEATSLVSLPVLLHGLLFVFADEYGALPKTARIDAMVTYGLWGFGFAGVLGILRKLADERADALPSAVGGLLLGGLLAVPLPLGDSRRFSLGRLIEKTLHSHGDPAGFTDTDMCIEMDGMALYIDDLTFTYHPAAGTVTDISLSGYVLSDPK